MNKKERLSTAITLSFFAHFLFLQTSWNLQEKPSTHTIEPTVLEFEQVQQAQTTNETGLSLQQYVKNNKNKALNDQKRLIRQIYLKEIQQEIHKKRLTLGNKNLIGVVWYSFQINHDGSFDSIRLEKKSTNPNLDKDAYYAIISASKKIKRPLLLGKDSFNIMIPIKYQYSLY